jgi:hypothetical protein
LKSQHKVGSKLIADIFSKEIVMANSCLRNNEIFRGAGNAVYRLPAKDKMTAWRRLRDKANKDAAIRESLVIKAILGGIHPNILKGLGED